MTSDVEWCRVPSQSQRATQATTTRGTSSFTKTVGSLMPSTRGVFWVLGAHLHRIITFQHSGAASLAAQQKRVSLGYLHVQAHLFAHSMCAVDEGEAVVRHRSHEVLAHQTYRCFERRPSFVTEVALPRPTELRRKCP